MLKDINDHVRFCSTFQQYEPSKQPLAGLLQTAAPQPRFETVAVDLFGPLHTTAEQLATHHVEFSPLQKQLPSPVPRLLLKNTSCDGLRRKLISDNGTQFVFQIMQYAAERCRQEFGKEVDKKK